MASRLPAPRLGSPGDVVRWGDVADFLRYVRELEILRGRFVDASFVSANAVNVEHGLGRSYRGGFVVWMSDATSSPIVRVLNPAVVTGADTIVALGATASWTGSCRLWVF